MKLKPVQSLQRGLALLEHLSERADGASLKDLASHLGTSSAATYHLILTLVERGYARRLEKPIRYTLGERWLTIAAGQAAREFTSAIHDEMLNIARRLPGVGVHFSEPIAESIVVVAHIASSLPDYIQRESRHVLPPYVSGGSLAHLAFWPDDVSETYQNRYPFNHYGLPFWRTRKAYEKALATMRSERFFLMPEDSPLKLKLAMPVCRAGGAIGGALTLQWNQDNLKKVPGARLELINTALQASAALQKRLGSINHPDHNPPNSL